MSLVTSLRTRDHVGLTGGVSDSELVTDEVKEDCDSETMLSELVVNAEVVVVGPACVLSPRMQLPSMFTSTNVKGLCKQVLTRHCQSSLPL